MKNQNEDGFDILVFIFECKLFLFEEFYDYLAASLLFL